MKKVTCTGILDRFSFDLEVYFIKVLSKFVPFTGSDLHLTSTLTLAWPHLVLVQL